MNDIDRPAGPDFTARRALVTGGSNGIGAAIADRLTELGGQVIVLDAETTDRHPFLQVDLADPPRLTAVFESAVARLGGLDILVNCAGISYAADVREIEADRYHRTMAVNLHAPVFLMQAAARVMAPAGYGRIVNISSIHARVSEPGCLAYDTAKGGLEAATRAVAVDLAGSGVLVNAVAPGFVATRMAVAGGVDELDSEWFRTVYLDHGQLPLGRAARPAEIAETVAWLASAGNTYTTGQVLTVDGGLTARL